MKKVIIVNGKGRSGKDTFVALCKCNITDICVEFSIVDEVKMMASQMGWQGLKRDVDRLFLANLKDIWEDFNGGPSDYLHDIILCTAAEYIFVHMRTPIEIDQLKGKLQQNVYQAFKVITILVDSNNDIIEDNYNGSVIINHADDMVAEYSYDIYISNTGTLDELEEKAKHFINTKL